MKGDKQLQESIYPFHTQKKHKSMPGDAFFPSLLPMKTVWHHPHFMFEVIQGELHLKHLCGTGDME